MPRELLTLQLGSYANFVGAHYWNLQDEILGYADKPEWQAAAAAVDSEVLLAWREDRHGQLQYHPRSVLVDLNGSFGGVSFSADAAARRLQQQLPPSGPACSTWAAGVEVHAAEAVPPSAFTQQLFAAEELDSDDEEQQQRQQCALEEAAGRLGRRDGVAYWTDYLKAPLHPRSPLTLPGVWGSATDVGGFGGAAAALLAPVAELVDAAADNLRWWAEQCDSPQGFQVLADDLGGYGTLGCSLLEHIQDAFPRAPVVYYSLRPSASGDAADAMLRARCQLSECLSLAQAAQLASLYVPLQAPWSLSPALRQLLAVDASSAFQSSALLAAAVDGTTLPCRLTGEAQHVLGAVDLHSLTGLLAGRCPNLVATSLQLPAGALPADAWAAAAAQDARLQPGRHPAADSEAGPHAAAAAGDPGPDARLQLQGHELELLPAALASGGHARGASPVVGAAGHRGLAAECITLRGVLRGKASAPVAEVAACLDRLMAADQQRAVRHRCVLDMPLAVPLPFPPVFTAAVGRCGDIIRPGAQRAEGAPLQGQDAGAPVPGSRQQQQQQPAGSAGCHVATCPQLTRARTSTCHAAAFRAAGGALKAAAGSIAGGHFLRAWDYAPADMAELQEQLVAAAARYDDAADDDEGEDGL